MIHNSVHFNDVDHHRLQSNSEVTTKGDYSYIIYADPKGSKKHQVRLVAHHKRIGTLQKEYRSGLPRLISSIEQEIINFENVRMKYSSEITSSPYFEGKKVKTIGVLRDYYNNFSSELYSLPDTLAQEAILELLTVMKKCWLDIAYKYLNNPEDVILFNSWNLDNSYRQSLSDRFNLRGSDYGFEEISTFGGGSSFDNSLRHKLHRRYENIIDMPLFRQYAHDPEIIELNKKIFNLEIF